MNSLNDEAQLALLCASICVEIVAGKPERMRDHAEVLKQVAGPGWSHFSAVQFVTGKRYKAAVDHFKAHLLSKIEGADVTCQLLYEIQPLMRDLCAKHGWSGARRPKSSDLFRSGEGVS